MHLTRLGTTFAAVILIACNLFYSCKKEYTKEITALDSLNTLLINTQAEFESIDSLMIEKYYQELLLNLNTIQNSSSSLDTIPAETSLLSDYRATRKPFKFFREKRSFILNELKYSKKQLDNLKHDLQNNTLASDSIDVYFQAEIAAANNALQSTQALINNVKPNISKFEEYNIQIKNIIAAKQDSLITRK